MNKDIILIFGGDGKIAKAIVKKYLDNNCVVIAVDKKEKSDTSSFYENSNYNYYCVDVTNIKQLSNLYNELSTKFKYVNHIISAVGAPYPSEMGGIFDISFEDIDSSIKLNLSSHLYVSKIFLPLLRTSSNENKSLVLFSSVNAMKSFDLPGYSAAKSGLFGFMNSIVRELGKLNIRVNTITPGTVATQQEIDEKYCNYKYKDMMALDKFTSPEDIADSVFSITHITKAITGKNIVVDSGQIS